MPNVMGLLRQCLTLRPRRRVRSTAHQINVCFGIGVEELESLCVLSRLVDVGGDVPTSADVTAGETSAPPAKDATSSPQSAKVERATPDVQGNWNIELKTDTNVTLKGTAEIKQTDRGKVSTTVRPNDIPFKFKLKGKFYEGSDTVSGRGKVTDPSSGKVISVYISLTASDNNNIDGNLILKVGDNPVRQWTITGKRI